MNKQYYGNNLDVMRKSIRDETVDLRYIDQPFNSKRNYNQIYNNIGTGNRAQAQAFTNTWTWDDHANQWYDDMPVETAEIRTTHNYHAVNDVAIRREDAS